MNEYQKNGQEFGWGPGVAKLNPEKAKLLKEFAVGKILDVACGSGIYTNYLSKIGHSVIGLDNQPEFIKKAKAKYPSVNFRVGDGLGLPFPNNSFDTVVLFDILEHLDGQKLIKEALRVGNRLIISVPHQNQPILLQYGLSHAHYLDTTHQRVYTSDSLTKLLKKFDLKIIYLEPSLPISLSGILVNRLANDNILKKVLLKTILKPFLPEPPIYSTLFAIAQRS